MAPFQRLILPYFLLLMVGGCSDASELRKENRKLREQIEQQQAYYEHDEAQAGIAAGCDFLIPICPDSITEPGHLTQKKLGGAGGGLSMWFWLAFIGKLAGIGTLFGAAYGSLSLIKTKLTAPAETEAKNARKTIQEAEEEAKKILYAAKQGEANSLEEARQARDQSEYLKEHVALLQKQIVDLKEQLQREEESLELIRKAKKALDLF